MSTYLDSQFGFAEESTWGTRVAPTRFLEFNSESVKTTIDYIESKAYRAGRKTKLRQRQGAIRSTGSIVQELAPQGLGLWLKHAFGSISTTGAGPYTHTITPGAINGKGLTVQFGRTDTGGTERPFDYLGCKITDWEISAQVGEIPILTTNIWAKQEKTDQTLATATYPTGLLPFVFTEGSLTVGGTATPIKSISLKGDNGLMVDRHRITSTTPTLSLEPQESSVRDYSGTLTADFVDLTAYTRFTAQTAAALVLTFAQSSPAHSLTITANVEFTGETPNAGGSGQEIEQPLPFVALSTTGDSSVISLSLVNADATP